MIRDADSRQVTGWIKVWGRGMGKPLHQRVRAQSSLDEITNEARLVDIADYEVVSTLVFLCLRRGGACLFMVVLAMNE